MIRFLLVVLLIAGVASADGNLTVGPATVSVRNGHAEDCGEPTGLCLFSVRGSSAGDTEVDASQQFYFAGVLVNDSVVENATGVDLLPDGGMRIGASDLVLRHDVFRIFVENVGTIRGPGQLSSFAIFMDEERYGVAYFGPSPGDPAGGLAAREHTYGFQDGWIGYDSFTPLGTFGNASTDGTLDDALNQTCEQSENDTCHAARAVGALALDATPNADLGAGLYEVGVNAPPPEVETAVGDRDAPAASIGPRHAPRLPQHSLPRAPPRPSLELGEHVPYEPEPHAPTPLPRGPEPLLSTSVQETSPPTPPRFAGALVITAAFAIAVALALLYSRVFRSEERLLTRRRSEILRTLEAGPLTLADLARRVGLDRTTVQYHARWLAKAGKILNHRVGRRVIYALPDARPEAALPPRAADVLCKLLSENGGELSRETLRSLASEIPLRTQNRALRELRSVGMIERVQGAGTLSLRLVVGRPATAGAPSRTGSVSGTS